MPGKPDLQENAVVAAISEAPPHYHGHRKRLRARFRQAGAQGLAEYELLELVLFRALPRRDVKPIAKKLLEKFGSFAEVISAPPARLAEVSGFGEEAITDLKIVQAAANELLRGGLREKPVLSSWSAVLDYCRTAMAFADKQHFRILIETLAIARTGPGLSVLGLRIDRAGGWAHDPGHCH